MFVVFESLPETELEKFAILASSVSLCSSSLLFVKEDQSEKSASKQQKRSLPFLHGERNKC